MNCHETIDLMGDALEGCLTPELRAGFGEHLDECGPCRTYFDQLRVTVEALERMPHPSSTSPRRAELIAEFRRESKQSE